MKDLYKTPEAEVLELKLATDICAPSQADATDPGVGDGEEGDLI